MAGVTVPLAKLVECYVCIGLGLETDKLEEVYTETKTGESTSTYLGTKSTTSMDPLDLMIADP